MESMNDFTSLGPVGIIVTRRYATYKDEPGRLYHYPKQAYERAIHELRGRLVLVYEPKRGGVSAESLHGGRSAFIGFAWLGDTRDDTEDPSHAFVELKSFAEFATPVRISSTRIPGNALQTAVQRADPSEAERILRLGFHQPIGARRLRERDGLVDLSDLDIDVSRPIREIISNRAVRDVSFRYRVVEQVYEGRCAFTGIRLTNGYGRAETDAAHIMPVARGGPDSVRNGIALSKTAHWAFDRGLLSLADYGQILMVDRGIDENFRRVLSVNDRAILPSNPADRPHASFLRWHRSNVFKGAP